MYVSKHVQLAQRVISLIFLLFFIIIINFFGFIFRVYVRLLIFFFFLCVCLWMSVPLCSYIMTRYGICIYFSSSR